MPKKKKVVIFGITPDRQAVYEVELRGYELKFVSSDEAALSNAKTAAVVAANLDMSGTFFGKLFERGYEGPIVPITSSSIRMRKAVTLPSGKSVFPTSCRNAPNEILQALSK